MVFLHLGLSVGCFLASTCSWGSRRFLGPLEDRVGQGFMVKYWKELNFHRIRNWWPLSRLAWCPLRPSSSLLVLLEPAEPPKVLRPKVCSLRDSKETSLTKRSQGSEDASDLKKYPNLDLS